MTSFKKLALWFVAALVAGVLLGAVIGWARMAMYPQTFADMDAGGENPPISPVDE